jgi:antitoxin component YwqK of YwqJK toxin-antitoxin module
LFHSNSLKLYNTMKDYKFCFLLFLMFSCHIIIAQTDYNKIDEKGKKNGVWKGFYQDSKRPRYEGTFEHGKEVGVFNFYDDTKAKSIIATREFNSTDNSAHTVFYDQAKNKVSEGKVINKLFDGQWKYYHQASKTVMTVENYKNGKLEGMRSVYYPSGKIAEEINYRDNVKEGVYKSFSDNGIVLEESTYKDNEYNGSAAFKDPQGNLVSKGEFLHGKKSGVWHFFTIGKPVKEINMSTSGNALKSKGN